MELFDIVDEACGLADSVETQDVEESTFRAARIAWHAAQMELPALYRSAERVISALLVDPSASHHELGLALLILADSIRTALEDGSIPTCSKHGYDSGEWCNDLL